MWYRREDIELQIWENEDKNEEFRRNRGYLESVIRVIEIEEYGKRIGIVIIQKRRLDKEDVDLWEVNDGFVLENR